MFEKISIDYYRGCRLDVHNFVLSRTQKRVIRNMENYLRFGREPKGVKEEDNRGKGPPQQAEKKVEKEDISDKGERVPGERGQKKKDLRKMRAIQRWTVSSYMILLVSALE